jgi:hypothetical protein
MKQLRDRMINMREVIGRAKRKKGFMSLWLTSQLNIILVLEIAIAELGGDRLNFERLVKLLPYSLGSRSTIGYVLDDFVQRKYLCKNVGSDRRKRVYSICPGAMQLLDDWFKERAVSLKEVA